MSEVLTSLAVYVGAAIAEIAGCFAFWAWLRLDRSPLWLLPGLASRRLAGAQDDDHRTRALGIVDVDRQEAPLIVIGIEQRQLLAAMNDINAVVDVENDGIRLFSVASNPLIDQRMPDDVAEGWSILEARDRRLRAQIKAAVRQPTTGQFEGRILAQVVEIIAILVAAADRENPGAKDAIERMRHPILVALVWKQPGEALDDANPFLRQGQQGDAAIGRQSATVESSDHLLQLDGWQGKRQQRIFGHGGYGWLGFEESV